MESALIGLLGVVVGSLLATAKDWWLHHHKLRVEARHLCLVVAFKLDRYVESCCSAATDEGQDNEDGITEITTSRPLVDATAVAGDWRALPVRLINSVYNLQLDSECANGAVDNAFEMGSMPDFFEAFEERQYQYSKLGLQAFELANLLRKHAGVSTRNESDWPVGRMRCQLEKIESRRRQRFGPTHA